MLDFIYWRRVLAKVILQGLFIHPIKWLLHNSALNKSGELKDI
jgi:hypothetical protein